MLAEVIQGKGTDLRGVTWWGDDTGFSVYLAPNTSQPDSIYTIAYCDPSNNPPCTGASDSANLPEMYAARSRHPGGVNVALCDGSVHFVNNTIESFYIPATSTTPPVLGMWQKLGTSRGGEPIAGTY